ncbi:MAG TPA: NYN domain-containing protein [Oligoflexia bacterium]|nr:NYN domain-containing protein [Oligoflexia bacterium]HMP27822.1 NYN domain-containing protein [Oligoflexia bacterium]
MNKKEDKNENVVIKRAEKRTSAILIDGVNLDRASRRLGKKIDFLHLIKTLSGGIAPIIARYYSIIPYTDDARQLAFLQAVSKVGLSVILKRLPPVGSERVISIDCEIATDLISFAYGRNDLSSTVKFSNFNLEQLSQLAVGKVEPIKQISQAHSADQNEKRSITLVCPSPDLSYPIALAGELGTETICADFGPYGRAGIVSTAKRWIDLKDANNIWLTD